MVAIFPCLLSKSSTGTIQCMHGGIFTGEPSTTTKFDGEFVAITKAGFADKTPCPGEGVTAPPCKLTVPALTMATRVTVDTISLKPVTVITPQVSSSNGRPAFIAVSSSVGVKVL